MNIFELQMLKLLDSIAEPRRHCSGGLRRGRHPGDPSAAAALALNGRRAVRPGGAARRLVRGRNALQHHCRRLPRHPRSQKVHNNKWQSEIYRVTRVVVHMGWVD